MLDDVARVLRRASLDAWRRKDDVARVLRRASLDAWRRKDDADGRESGVNDDMNDRCRRVTRAALRANAVEPIARGVVK